MAKIRHQRCPNCGSLDTKKNGHHRGYTRYYCKSCKHYFTDRRSHISARNMFVWFERWVCGKQSIEQLAQDSHYSTRSLLRYFHRMLPRCPEWQMQRRDKVNLMIYGTYFTNEVCLILYRDYRYRVTQLYRFTKTESLREIKEDLQNILNLQIQIESVTCDGAANIIRAVREVCPEAILQRCTFHVAHQVGLWLTKKPKSEAARELLELSKLLAKIQTQPDAQLWMRAFIDWYHKYEAFINEKSYDEESGRWWYKHKLLHRSTTHIKRAIPYLFNYTRYPNIPKISNSIESFFGHLKDVQRLHRGLSREHFINFIKWYLFFQSNKDKLKQKQEEL